MIIQYTIDRIFIEDLMPLELLRNNFWPSLSSCYERDKVFKA